MRVLILSRRKRFYSTWRLRDEAEKLGHEVLLIDPLKCLLLIDEGRPCLLYGPKMIKELDCVIPRIGTYGSAFFLAVLRHLDLMKVVCMNDHGPIARARNKFGCLQVLAQKGIPVPDTMISRYPRRLHKRIGLVGGTPVILKLLRGTQGTGVIYAENVAAVESVLETMWSLGEDIMLQRFVSESKGRDIRALVIDGEVRSCMRRVGRPGEFRSNIHRGGVGQPIVLPREYREVAVAAAEALNLKVSGVDILETKTGPQVIEVNSSPGFQGLEETTGDNVARMIVEFAVRWARRVKRGTRS